MVRMLRLLRLFTLLKIARYNGSLRTFAVAFSLAREQLVLTLCAAFLVILVASAGIYQFEHEAQPEVFVTFFDALWWSVATLTTVGYGDIFPITAGGKAFTTLVLFVGLGVVALPAGIISCADRSKIWRLKSGQFKDSVAWCRLPLPVDVYMHLIVPVV